jgi:hypothetical protein
MRSHAVGLSGQGYVSKLTWCTWTVKHNVGRRNQRYGMMVRNLEVVVEGDSYTRCWSFHIEGRRWQKMGIGLQIYREAHFAHHGLQAPGQAPR